MSLEVENYNLKNMKKHLIIINILAVIILLTPACSKYPKIEGNGQMAIETRQLVSFNKIDNTGTFNVYIKQDSVFSVTIQAESNLVPHVRTIINGNTLKIDTRENLKENYPVNVFVSTPVIEGAYLSGSGFVSLDSLDTDYLEIALSGSGKIQGYTETNSLVVKISGSGIIDLASYTNTSDIRISGSGDIYLTGASSSGSFSISGSGQIKSSGFSQNECVAKISGSGDMFLNVSDFLDVTIAGSGSIYYIGNPSTNVKITGSGQLIKQ